MSTPKEYVRPGNCQTMAYIAQLADRFHFSVLIEMKQLCRICTKLIKDEKLIKLFEKTHNWITKIEQITGILIKNTKSLPQHVCKLCQKDLEIAYDFRERCINAQQFFNTGDFLGPERTSNDLEIKDEIPYSIDEFNNTGIVGATDILIKDEIPIEEKNIPEFCFVKTETVDVHEEGEFRDFGSSRKSSFDDSDESAEFNADLLSLNKTKIYPEAAPTLKRQFGNRTKSPKEGHKKQKVKSRKGSRRKLKTEDDSNTFICDQCGNSFSCKSNFLTHQSRHTGVKEYHCEICPEQFFLHSELKRHVSKHTGEKPYQCRHCERRFVDYSSRFRHERTHTNERPYACTQCSKAFATSFILKNHMVTHTGVRTFWCNLCDKWFGQKPHLITHYKSMMHKQNEEKKHQDTNTCMAENVDSIKNGIPVTHKSLSIDNIFQN